MFLPSLNSNFIHVVYARSRLLLCINKNISITIISDYFEYIYKVVRRSEIYKYDSVSLFCADRYKHSGCTLC